MALAIERMRQGKVFLQPGYDGVYGVVSVFSKQEKEKLLKNQKPLF
ncbi:DNA helicase UvrD, partial [Candidatus Gribaldobacteria bacterium]|nr:DNA helicase UvrD [Candidatus Gribaldobacteria bacterium]